MYQRFFYYYCNVIALLYILKMVLIKLKIISLNSPISLAIYLLTWLIPLLGFPFVLFFGNKVRQRFNTPKKLRNTILLAHLIFLIPLLIYIPYYGMKITKSELIKTILYVLIFLLLYVVLVEKSGLSLLYLYGF